MKTVLCTCLAALLVPAIAGCQPAKPTTIPMKTNSTSDPASPAKPSQPADARSGPATAGEAVTPVQRTDEEWRKSLSAEQYRVLRQAGTEPAFGAAYEEFKKQGAGTYVCAGCGAELFSSKEKFDSHCGWPSFYDPANAKNVKTRDDFTHGMIRTEVNCARCNGHLGHVFRGEGFSTPTDTRYCINGVSLKFVPAAANPAPPSKPAPAK